MALSYNLGNQESISVHPTRRQIFAGKPYSTFPNIWEWVIYGRPLMIFRKEKGQTYFLTSHFLLIFNSWAGAVCTTNNTSCGGSIPCICGLVLTWNSTFTAAYWQNDGLVLTSSIICQDFKKEDGSFERSSASQHSGNDVREATKKIGKMKDLVLKRGGWVQES